MTPLAHKIIRDSFSGPGASEFIDRAKLMSEFRREFHPFEVTQVLPLMRSFASTMMADALPSIEWSFLPAERTWIEWEADGVRLGAMMIRDGGSATVVMACDKPLCSEPLGILPLRDDLERFAADPARTIELHKDWCGTHGDRTTVYVVFALYAALLIINSPKVIGRTLERPHRGLVRQVSRRAVYQPFFPLQAYTEIQLRAETIDETAAADVTSTLTGRLCEHWVRAHQQRYRGIWQIVRDYWRGDPALGTRHSRYIVHPPAPRT